ncbi:MAG: FHA domain-containing protein [Dehalococcoidales bacterium]
MNVTLRSLHDGQSPLPGTYLLNSGSTLIGSDTNCSLQLDSPSLSRWHCIVDVAPSAVYITDLHSLNGTYVNDRRAIRQPLHNADILRLGDVSFIVRINASSDLPGQIDDYPLPVLPTQLPQTKAQPPPLAASALAALLPSPVRQVPAVSSVPQAPPARSSYPLAQLTRQMARYEKALTQCTAQLRLLTEKVVTLESRINAITPSALPAAAQHSPKKAFERHDALMYIARAAVSEKVRRQNVSSSSPPRPDHPGP